MTNAKLYASEDFRTLMTASMVLDQKTVGVINVFSRENVRSFTDDDLSLLKALANQAATAINNARLFEQISKNRKRLSDLSRALIQAQEKERRSLALELHDEFGQILSSIKMSLDMLSLETNLLDRSHLERAQTLAMGLLKKVRRMSLELRPAILDDMGLHPALAWLFKDYGVQTGQDVHFEYSGLDKRFPTQMEITVYRIVQEALTNIIRHAENKAVFVNIWVDENTLNLQITDQGRGFNPAIILTKATSSGLSGMRERTRLLGGEMVVESSTGIGTTLSVRLPIGFETAI
jgi:signal transduction histidine kinase